MTITDLNLKTITKAASFLTGGLFVAGHAVDLGADGPYGSVMGGTLTLLAHLSAVFAFIGLYAARGGKRGLFGLIGTLAAAVGTILVTAIVYVETAGAGNGKEAADLVFQEPVPGALLQAGPLLFAVGLVLFGGSFLGNRGYSRAGGVNLIAGTVVFGLGGALPDMQSLIELAGSALTAAGFVLLGLALSRESVIAAGHSRG